MPCRLLREAVVFCCSGVTARVKAEVRELAGALGGQLLSRWTPACTHLVMSKLTVTVKVGGPLPPPAGDAGLVHTVLGSLCRQLSRGGFLL